MAEKGITKIYEITEEIKRLIKDSTLNFYQVGTLLKQVKDEKMWRAGYESFDAYIADPELGISRTSAYNAIQLVEHFAYEEVKDLDYSKVTKIIPALTVKPKDELLGLAGSLSRSDLTKEVAEIMGKTLPEPVPFISRCPICNKIKGVRSEDLCQGH